MKILFILFILITLSGCGVKIPPKVICGLIDLAYQCIYDNSIANKETIGYYNKGHIRPIHK